MAAGKQRTRAKRKGSKQIWRDLFKGLLFVAVLLVAKLGVERTSFGEQLEIMTYNLLQLRLSTQSSADDPAIIIVDIGDLEPERIDLDGWDRLVTPRRQLFELIEAVVDQGASAVGVDIDFSPHAKHGYWDPGDLDFFQKCLETKKRAKVPIYLGIARSQDLPPEQWLGDEKYEELGANISVPRPDVRRLFQWLRTDGQSRKGTTMCAALAESKDYSGALLPKWLGWAAHQTSERRLVKKPVTVGDFLVDYSLINSLEQNRLRTKNRDTIIDQGWQLNNKIVLLGDATRHRQNDTFLVPAQKEPIPGVYLHACGAFTLHHPLFELTGPGRWGIDLVLSAGIIATIAFIRLYYKDKRSQYINTERLLVLLAWLVAAAALIVGVLFVRVTRLMWNDFMLVIGAVLLHPSVDRNLGKAWPSIKRALGNSFEKLIFKERGRAK